MRNLRHSYSHNQPPSKIPPRAIQLYALDIPATVPENQRVGYPRNGALLEHNSEVSSNITVSSRTESQINDIRTSTKKRRRGGYNNAGFLDGGVDPARRRKRGCGGSPRSCSDGTMPRPERGSIGSAIAYTRGRTTASTTPQDGARRQEGESTTQDRSLLEEQQHSADQLQHFGAANLEKMPEKRDWWLGFRSSTVPDAVVPFPGLESTRPSVERESARPSERGSREDDPRRRTRGLSMDEIMLDLEQGGDLPHAVSGADRGNISGGVVSRGLIATY